MGLVQVTEDKQLRQLIVRKKRCLKVLLTDNLAYSYEEVPNSWAEDSFEIEYMKMSADKETLVAVYSKPDNPDEKVTCKVFKYDQKRMNYILKLDQKYDAHNFYINNEGDILSLNIKLIEEQKLHCNRYENVVYLNIPKSMVPP
jgi:hypothetical protein